MDLSPAQTCRVCTAVDGDHREGLGGHHPLPIYSSLFRLDLICVNARKVNSVHCHVIAGLSESESMPMAHWSPNFSVGVEELDSDHQELIEVLDQLDAEVSRAAGRQSHARRRLLRTRPHHPAGKGEDQTPDHRASALATPEVRRLK